jgi:hypothetical protein
MINKITETFELSDVETKTFGEFQDLLLQMKEISIRQDTQHIIENIYCNIINLISVEK